MVSYDILQAAVYALLKKDAALAVETTDIRESGYQGPDFAYPNVRILMQDQRSIADICDNKSVLTFTVSCYSDAASSRTCSRIVDVARRALNRHQLLDPVTPKRFSGGKIRSLTMTSAYRISSNLWRADAHFVVKVNESVV